jgi:hypothetical protein
VARWCRQERCRSKVGCAVGWRPAACWCGRVRTGREARRSIACKRQKQARKQGHGRRERGTGGQSGRRGRGRAHVLHRHRLGRLKDLFELRDAVGPLALEGHLEHHADDGEAAGARGAAGGRGVGHGVDDVHLQGVAGACVGRWVGGLGWVGLGWVGCWVYKWEVRVTKGTLKQRV